MNFARPFSADTLVKAAVNVVLPWSTCPIVPTFTCGFRRSYFAFAMPYSLPKISRSPILLALVKRMPVEYALLGAHDADRTRDLVLTKDVLYQLSYVGLYF